MMITLIIVGIIIVAILSEAKRKSDNLAKITIGRMFQMLESFEIINNTVNPKIFTQRLNLLGEIARSLPEYKQSSACAKPALQIYTNKYPNVNVTSTHRLIIEQPSVAYSPKFRDEATTAFYIRTCHNLKIEISTLKSIAAKQRRIIKASELAELIIPMLTSPDKQRYIDVIHSTCAEVSANS